MAKEQKHKRAWCPMCKTESWFINHADKDSLWICTNSKCNQYTTSELKEKPKVPQPQSMEEIYQEEIDRKRTKERNPGVNWIYF